MPLHVTEEETRQMNKEATPANTKSTCLVNTKAPSTRIRVFLNPQRFLSGFKNFPVYTKCIQIDFSHPHASDGIRIYCCIHGSPVIKRAKVGGTFVLFPRLALFHLKKQL